MLSALEVAKRRGAKIIAVNPLREAGLINFRNPQTPRGLVGKGTDLADLHLPIKINGDLALFQAWGALLVQWNALDHEFIGKHTHGFDSWLGHVSAIDWDLVEATTGLSRDQITEAAQLLRESDRTVFCWAMGLTQHHNAVATISEIVNLALAQGNIGKPGAGLLPVRGHSNVQGDRTMGIWERPPAHFLDRLQAEFGFDPPRENGYDTVDAIRALRDGRAKIFIGLGGNFVQAAPDTEVTAAALTRGTADSADFNQDQQITPDMRCDGVDLADPGSYRGRHTGKRSAVCLSGGLDLLGACFPRTADSRQSSAAVRGIDRYGLAEATLGDRYGIDWQAMRDDYRQIRRHIARVVPGCESYEVNVSKPGGFVMPHPPRDSRTFPTKSGRAEFTVSAIEALQVPPRHLILQSIRSHDQFNTTIYGFSDRYRGIEGGRRVVFVNPGDIEELGFHDGDIVDLVTHWEGDDHYAGRGTSGSLLTRPRAARPRRTIPRPIRWFRWIPRRWVAILRRRSR